MHFNNNTGEFNGQFRLDTNVHNSTVVHAFERGKGLLWYPAGIHVHISESEGIPLDGKLNITSHQDNRYKFIITDHSLNGHLIDVRVTGK